MKQNTKVILVSVILVVALALFSFASFFFSRIPSNPSGTVGNTAGNLNNKGLFCEANGVVYFSNPFDQGALYSMNPDETNVKKISDSFAQYINASPNHLYYYQTGVSTDAGLGSVRTTRGVYRCNLNGKKVTSLSREIPFSIQLVNDNLYYYISTDTGPQTLKTSTNGDETTVIADYIINPACVSDNTIYFNGTTSDHNLYSMDDETNTISMVLEYSLWNPILQDGYVYFMDVLNNYRLCRYPLFGGNLEILTNERVDSFNLSSDMIYYQVSVSDAPGLRRMYLDGSNPETVAEGVYENINITSTYVYFNEFQEPTAIYRTPVSGSLMAAPFDAARQVVLDRLTE